MCVKENKNPKTFEKVHGKNTKHIIFYCFILEPKFYLGTAVFD